jgi:hypothetical protein
MSREDLKRKWGNDASILLKGKTVKDVRYLKDNELEGLAWDRSTLVIFFDDGSYIFASSDDEGNAPGALFTSSDTHPTIPVI